MSAIFLGYIGFTLFAALVLRWYFLRGKSSTAYEHVEEIDDEEEEEEEEEERIVSGIDAEGPK